MLDYREPAFGGVALSTVAIRHVEYNSTLEGRYYHAKSVPPLKLLPKWSPFINSGTPLCKWLPTTESDSARCEREGIRMSVPSHLLDAFYVPANHL